MSPVAVITGASSGIGAATARRLAASGYHVVAAARRLDRVEALAAEISGTAVRCDVTSDSEVAALVEALPGPVEVLINNAGLAIGVDTVEKASPEDWLRMYDVNVLGAQRVTRALLPSLESTGRGTVLFVSSTAGLITYEGGGGYAAAKHGMTVLAETLRLELCGRPVRILEIDPGMVATDEFSLVRFGGDASAAARVYDGVAEPLTADDIADCIDWMITRPHHVNVDRLVVKPLAQAAAHKVHRTL